MLAARSLINGPDHRGDREKPEYIVLPPPLHRPPGRPRVARKRDEDDDPKLVVHRKCQKCGLYGHNKRTCKGPQRAPPVRGRGQSRGIVSGRARGEFGGRRRGNTSPMTAREINSMGRGINPMNVQQNVRQSAVGGNQSVRQFVRWFSGSVQQNVTQTAPPPSPAPVPTPTWRSQPQSWTPTWRSSTPAPAPAWRPPGVAPAWRPPLSSASAPAPVWRPPPRRPPTATVAAARGNPPPPPRGNAPAPPAKMEPSNP